jgi:hypothetical protein
VDHRTILDAVSRLRTAGTTVTYLTIAAELGVDDEEVLEDIGDAVDELVSSGRLRRVETTAVIGGKPAPFPTVSFEVPAGP